MAFLSKTEEEIVTFSWRPESLFKIGEMCFLSKEKCIEEGKIKNVLRPNTEPMPYSSFEVLWKVLNSSKQF